MDQLTQLKTPDTTASFAYDPLGRRTSYTKAGTLKTYLLNGLDVLNDGSSNFLHGVGLDEHLQVNTSAGSMSYLNDHLGSTSQLIDSSNAISKARLDYKSYGKLEGDSANTISANPYTYTGREDDGTGLYYYRNRYYDPELGMFISQDPLGDAQRYVKGNPVSLLDPLGLLDVAFGNGYNALPLPSISNKGLSLTWQQTSWAGSYVPSSATVVSSRLEMMQVLNNIAPGETVNIFSHGNSKELVATFANSQDTESIGIGVIPSVFNPLKNKHPGSIKIFACHVGAAPPAGYNSNFAEELSKFLPDTPIYATPDLSNGTWGLYNKYLNGKKVGSEWLF